MSRVFDQYKRASKSLAGGVSSSTRVNQALGHPLYIDRAEGFRVWDLDGRPYIDLCCSHGATLLGHGDARVRRAVEGALARGAACSYESELHAEFAALLCDTIPSLERVRFTGSGTEATMHCIRLARAVTGRTKLLRFEGNFHGYHDQVMFGARELGQFAPPLSPQSTGVTPGLEQHLLQIPYNNVAMLNQAFDQNGNELAAAICEPIYYNAGCILPDPEFIATLRTRTRESGALLVFDEVLSAFRMCAGGAQQYLGVTPDLCTLGKSVGGGYPLSVFGGRQELMQQLIPQGDCQHSGTYNAHPVAVAAALAAVETYREESFYPHINALGERLIEGINAVFQRHGVPGLARGLGARFGIYFGIDGPIRNYADAQQHDRQQMLRFIAAAIEEGVYFHDYGGVACHHGFCAAMTLDAVEEALEKLDKAVARLTTS
jgi:glutamate-1-semialdehyde 2,1-aminomutase